MTEETMTRKNVISEWREAALTLAFWNGRFGSFNPKHTFEKGQAKSARKVFNYWNALAFDLKISRSELLDVSLERNRHA